jgi:hypothetical protein
MSFLPELIECISNKNLGRIFCLRVCVCVRVHVCACGAGDQTQGPGHCEHSTKIPSTAGCFVARQADSEIYIKDKGIG